MLFKLYIMSFLPILFISGSVLGAPIKETPNNSKPTDLHCIFSSYRLRNVKNEMQSVQIRICSRASAKIEPSKRQTLSERKSK